MGAREPSSWGGLGIDWAAMPGKARADLPLSVLFNGREVAIYTFAQVDRLGKKALKERAMNIRDLVGAQSLPRFSPGFQEEQMVAWILEAQTVVAAACGVMITVGDLGAPKGGDGVGAFLAHLQDAAPQPPPELAGAFWGVAPPQQQQQQQSQQQRQPTPSQQFHPPPQEAYQSAPTHAYRGGPSSGGGGPSPMGSSPLRPDQESDAVRDAARKRNQGSFSFG